MRLHYDGHGVRGSGPGLAGDRTSALDMRRCQVLSIDVNPKTKPRLSDLHLDLSKYKKVKDEHLPEVVYYSEEEKGITLMVFPNGEVGKLFYGPAKSDSPLCCSDSSTRSVQPTTGYGLTKFDEYGKLPLAKEKKRFGPIRNSAKPHVE